MVVITKSVLIKLDQTVTLCDKNRLFVKTMFFFSSSSSFCPFPKFKKLNISVIYEAIILILQWIFFLIQPPGEPREQHLGDVRPKQFELQKISKKTKWPEGSIYLGAFLRKLQKIKNEAQQRKNIVFGLFICKLS